MDNKNAVALARVSGRGQEIEGYSLDAQHKLLMDYSARQELHIMKEFLLTENASVSEGRKVFKEMMAFASVKKNRVAHIVVEKADRYTRNFKDAVLLDDWLAANSERKLHSVKESLILHTNAKSDVKFMWNINVAAAKKYTDTLREEIKKGYTEKLAQGWLPHGPPPGYMNITTNGRHVHHAPDPKTKPILINAFKKYLEPGESVGSIRELMDHMGLRNRVGRPHCKARVHEILDDPYYVGIIRFDGQEYPGAHEPLISKELYAKVQQKLHGKRPNRYRQHNPVFKGVISCKNCGGLVTWQLQKGRYYGTCQRNSDACRGRKLLREDRIEAEVVVLLEKLVCPSQEIIQWVADTMRGQHQNSIEEKEHLWNSVKTQIDRVERMDDRLYEDKLAGEISIEKYVEKHAEFGRQQTELRKQLESIDKSFGNRLDQVLVLLELSQKAAQIYAKRTPQQKRLIITKLFKEVVFDNNDLSVSYTNFAQIIARNVLETKKLIGDEQ
ncbi:MAG TPA: recombinase family protein [Patescibacteria group bacterium]|nr:recombinase family protein [Patescibacteria group bacterium]